MNDLIKLYSYKNVFKENKFRPGFMLGDRLFVLSSTSDQGAIARVNVEGRYFQGRPQSFLHEVKGETPDRYNDNFCGFLIVTPELEDILRNLCPRVEDYIIRNTRPTLLHKGEERQK